MFQLIKSNNLIIERLQDENSNESDTSEKSFDSDNSHDLFIPQLDDNDGQSAQARLEGSVVAYLEGLGLIFKTDPRQKEYKIKIQKLDSHSIGFISSHRECTDHKFQQDIIDFDLNLELSPKHSVNDGEINDDLMDVLKKIKSNPGENNSGSQTQDKSLDSPITKSTTSFQNSTNIFFQTQFDLKLELNSKFSSVNRLSEGKKI